MIKLEQIKTKLELQRLAKMNIKRWSIIIYMSGRGADTYLFGFYSMVLQGSVMAGQSDQEKQYWLANDTTKKEIVDIYCGFNSRRQINLKVGSGHFFYSINNSFIKEIAKCA